MTNTPSRFTRDRVTWLLYLSLAYFAYFMSIIGPLMNFLSPELGLSDTLRGLHLSGYAVGMIVASSTGERVAQRLGRSRLMWLGGGMMALAAVLLTLAQSAWLTIPAAFLLGWLGTYMLIMIQALLSDRHPSQRAVALSESNVAAIILSTSAPLAVSAAVGLGLGWRAALWLGALAFLLLWGLGRALPLEPAAPPRSDVQTQAARLPRQYWIFWAVSFFNVGVEWTMIFWSGAFLERVTGLSTADATTASSLFFAGMMVGRVGGARLASQIEPLRLLLVSMGMVIFGFSIYWLAPLPEMTLIGLFMTGLGVANLYPLTLAIAVGTAPAAADLASSRFVLATGAAMLLMPQILGTLADSIGIHSASSITGVLAFIALLTTMAGLRLNQLSSAG